jgi:hypothetical protein
MGEAAIHEAGHAVAAMLLGHGDRICPVTVSPEPSHAPVLRTAQGATELEGEPLETRGRTRPLGGVGRGGRRYRAIEGR